MIWKLLKRLKNIYFISKIDPFWQMVDRNEKIKQCGDEVQSFIDKGVSQCGDAENLLRLAKKQQELLERK